MIRNIFKLLLTIVLLFFLLGAGPCGGNRSGSSTPAKPSNEPRLSENQVVGAVKALIKIESQSHKENRQNYVTTMCSAQRAAYDNKCQPCAPGSPNFCIRELVTEVVDVPGRCRFPPSDQAQWSAEFFNSTKTWQVESNDRATGRNRWTVDDQSGQVLSGYCVFK